MLALAVVHFNFAGFLSPVRNLHHFCRDMEMRGIEVFGLEYHLHGAPARMHGRKNWTTQKVSPRAVLFQKEHMLNRVVREMIPEHYNLIGCFDADIFFSEPHLESAIKAAMVAHRAIQPFESACWTDKTGGVFRRRPPTTKVPLTSAWRSHPGFAWVFRRDFWTRGPGLYDIGAAGGGDMVTSLALMGQPPFNSVTENLGGMQFENGFYCDYARRAFDWSQGSVGWIPGNAYHMYHGDRKNRRFSSRGHMLEGMDLSRDLKVSEDGVLQWAGHVPNSVPRMFLEFFKGRDEDN